MADEDLQHSFEVAAVDDEQMVETLTADIANPSLGVRVGHRRPHGGGDDPRAGRAPDVVEGPAELGVAIADQVGGSNAARLHGGDDVAGLLGDPLPGRLRGDPGEPDAPRADLDETARRADAARRCRR